MRATDEIRALGESFLNIIYPPLCLLCERNLEGERLLCIRCRHSLVHEETISCGRCGAPEYSGDGCDRSCICRNLPEELMRVRSVARYEGTVRDLIHMFKFAGYRGLHSIMADIMMETGRSMISRDRDPIVMGVPLHRARRRERGYDQAAVLAKAVAEGLGVECARGVLVRQKHSRPQSELSLDERRENLEDAFVVRNASEVEGRIVLLVDDVVTTGITLGSCARALGSAGARGTLALTFARRILTEQLGGE